MAHVRFADGGCELQLRMKKLVSTAVQTSFLGNPQYSTIVDREFNYLTAEYEMKWNIIEPAAGASVFGARDAIIDYALSRRMQVRVTRSSGTAPPRRG